jgi:hypothetical protein
MKKFLAAAVVAAVMGWGGTAQAESVNCPSILGQGEDRTFTLDTTPDALCYAYGTGNIEGTDSDFAGFTFLDKYEPGDTLGPLTITGIGTTSGTFSFSATLWDSYSSILVGFKAGTNLQPVWAAFALSFDASSGSWSINPEQGGALSHANLYGTPCTTPGCGRPFEPIPEPTSMLLLGTGLLGLATRVRRKK